MSPVTIEATESQIAMIEKFQCPGCTCGCGVEECDNFKFDTVQPDWFKCKGHSAGTMLMPGGKIALGLPKGFNKVGALTNSMMDDDHTTNIRLHENIETAESIWDDQLNLPIWAMEEDGYLFVRTYQPRINMGWIDIVKGGTMALVPSAIDVSKFIDEID
tara:strand:+ start:51068 stop:51547 length:480 start_codon:yes stop_codon:yes gene_type:complete